MSFEHSENWADDDRTESEDNDGAEDGDSEDEPTIACPHCRREIYDDAERCPYCEQYISGEDAPSSGKPWWIVIGAAVGLFVIVWWIIA